MVLGVQILKHIAIRFFLTLLHSDWPKLHRILAVLSAVWLFFVFQRNLSKVKLVHVVIGNEACDLDSSAAALSYSYYLHEKVN